MVLVLVFALPGKASSFFFGGNDSLPNSLPPWLPGPGVLCELALGFGQKAADYTRSLLTLSPLVLALEIYRGILCRCHSPCGCPAPSEASEALGKDFSEA